MAGNAVSTLNGLFKERYADKVKDLVPDHVKLYNAIKYDNSKKLGNAYNEPVILSLESGFTYGGETGDLFSLNDVKQFKMQNASIKARELVLRSAISIGALSRSASDPQAIEKAMDLMVGNMLKSMYHRLEVQMFYGQSGLGVVKTDAGVGTEIAIEIEDEQWASGIWNGTTGAEVEVFEVTAGALSARRGAFEITGYSLEDKTVTLKDLQPADGNVASILATDAIYFKGAAELAGKNEFLGIDGIATERVSLFGIANASEPLFQGSEIKVGDVGNPAVISFAKIEQGIAKMVEKGLMEEEVAVYVNPRQWDDLLQEQTAKREFDDSYSPSKLERGSKTIVFYGQNGTIKVVASTFVKEGDAFILAEKDMKRIGSTEVTFKRPDGEEYLELLEGKHGIEMRCYTDQALFTCRPASICKLKHIKSNVA